MTDNEKMRRFRRQAKNMAAMIDWPFEDAMERASGLCLCELCGLEYFDHPEENGLVLTCDGRLWKL
jgi:hypothetical protein